MRKRLWRPTGVVLAAIVVGMVTGVLAAGPASAHVNVDPSSAVQGSDATLAFRVPNEKDAADTTKLELNLPPIASVAVQPLAGWTVQADKTKLSTPITSDNGTVTDAVTKITWTASADAAIKPGQFQTFEISVGPLPETDKLVFKALQTYSDGDIVRWIEEPDSSGKESDHPAPTVTLAKADTTGDPAGTANGAAKTGTTKGGSNGTTAAAMILGIAGLVAGLAGLAMGLLGYRKATAHRA